VNLRLRNLDRELEVYGPKKVRELSEDVLPAAEVSAW
jgi:hypothetical protein